MDAAGAILLSIIVSVIAAEVWAWLPALADRLVRFHASRLPGDLRTRCEEEWAAALDSIAGHLGKLMFAADLFRASPRLRHEFLFPDVAFKPFTDAGLRCADLLSAAWGLIVAAPVLAGIALLLRIVQGGPVLAPAKRVGRYRREFLLLRFRTVGPNGERLSWLGTAVRWLRLDELPQLLNVLRGDMSFVGPRPRRPAYPGTSLKWNPALSVRPGITGLGQVMESVGESDEEWFDVTYVKRRNLALYLEVILLTVDVVLRGRWSSRMRRREGQGSAKSTWR